MSVRELSVYGEWLVQEADGCTCQGSDAHYGHQPGCGYEPLLKVAEVMDALKAAGYAVVELPKAEADWHGGMSKWSVEQTWHGQADHPGEVTIRKTDGRIGVTSVSLPADSPQNARNLAAALLAAADAADAAEAEDDA